MQRRKFLWMTGAAATLALGNPLDGGKGKGLQRVRHRRRALGTQVTLTGLHADAETVSRALDAAFEELELVESLLSLYRPASQISMLNRQGRLDRPHPYFVTVLRAASDMSKLSQGAFDITVQPLWELYAATGRDGEPTEPAIARALGRVGFEGVDIDEESVTLRDGCQITLNGIAQGFAADRVMAVLRAHGVEHAIVDTGEFSAAGESDQGAPWRVGLQHPRIRDALTSVIELNDRCLATSGDYATTFSDDYRRHHLFHPRTGKSPTELASVSVVAPTAMLADALSTAIFVLGQASGEQLVQQLPNCEAFLVTR